MVFREQHIDHPFSFKQPTRIENFTIQYTGSWGSETNNLVPNYFAPVPYTFTNNSNDYFTVNFTGSAVAVYGSANTDHSLYSAVSQFLLDSNPQEVTPTQTIDGTTPRTYNSSSHSPLGNALLYYVDGLDGSQTHTLEMMNLGDPSVGNVHMFSMSYIEK